MSTVVCHVSYAYFDASRTGGNVWPARNGKSWVRDCNETDASPCWSPAAGADAILLTCKLLKCEGIPAVVPWAVPSAFLSGGGRGSCATAAAAISDAVLPPPPPPPTPTLPPICMRFWAAAAMCAAAISDAVILPLPAKEAVVAAVRDGMWIAEREKDVGLTGAAEVSPDAGTYSAGAGAGAGAAGRVT